MASKEVETSYIRSIFKDLDEHLNQGDPIPRQWFFLKSSFIPLILSALYLIIVKIILPVYMKNRKPYSLRKVMMVYNLFLTTTYIACLTTIIYNIRHLSIRSWCDNVDFRPGGMIYKAFSAVWVVYLLKYLEYFDTIFFVLRKKDHLITNLHVIHHFILPVYGFYCFRTERSGVTMFGIIVNSLIHTAMYAYYGLAAMGPSVRKYLWWKRYLTLAQIIQFVLFLLYLMVLLPLSGCSPSRNSSVLGIFLSFLFFVLFCNYYFSTFKRNGNIVSKQQ